MTAEVTSRGKGEEVFDFHDLKKKHFMNVVHTDFINSAALSTDDVRAKSGGIYNKFKTT